MVAAAWSEVVAVEGEGDASSPRGTLPEVAILDKLGGIVRGCAGDIDVEADGERELRSGAMSGRGGDGNTFVVDGKHGDC